MANPQIVDYIRTQLRQGTTKASIMTSMTAGGWVATDVEAAFAEAAKGFEPIKSSDSFAPTKVKEGRHLIRRAIFVFFLIIIIILCILFILGGA